MSGAARTVLHTLAIPHRQVLLVDHVDRNTCRRIGEPTPNPIAAAAGGGGS